MKWTKLALTTMTLATLGLCFTACDEPPPLETESDGNTESELFRDFHTGIFELDGNIHDDNTVPGDDWVTLPGESIAFTDYLDDAGKVSIFTGGGSKDPLLISNWRWTEGSVPDKNNITNAYAAAYPDGAGGINLYFGADRFATAGDAFLGFWFFQEPVSLNPDGTFNGSHTKGDLLVLVNFDKGGSVPNVQVLEWDPAVPNNLKVLFEEDAKCGDGLAADACAITNPAPIVNDKWDYTPKTGPDGTIPVNAFFEGGIKLSALFSGEAPCFASFMAETRASTSVSATLKDFVVGSFQACNPGIEVTGTCETVLEDAGDELRVVVNYSGRVCNTSTGPGSDVVENVVVTGPDGVMHDVGNVAAVPPGEPCPGVFSGSFVPDTLPPGGPTFNGIITAKGDGVLGTVTDDFTLQPCPLCPPSGG